MPILHRPTAAGAALSAAAVLLATPAVGRPSIFRAVGTLVEAPGEAGTFSGHVFRDGVRTHFEDAALEVVLPEEDFLDYVCRAATGT